MDIENKFGIGICGPEIFILKPIPQHMQNTDALNLAAWLVAMATDDPAKDFEPVLDKVMQTTLPGI